MTVFDLFIESVDDKKNYQRLAEHFSNLKLTLSNGRCVNCVSEDYPFPYMDFWLEGIMAGTLPIQESADVSEAGIRLFDRLVSAPDFVFARFGQDADKWGDNQSDYLEE